MAEAIFRLLLARLLVQRMTTELRAILHQLKPLGPPCLLLNPVVPLTGFSTLKPDILSHSKSRRTSKSETGGRHTAGHLKWTLFDYLRHNARANRSATLTDSETTVV